jgi:DNA mismatch endonuclease (patch repair protein)
MVRATKTSSSRLSQPKRGSVDQRAIKRSPAKVDPARTRTMRAVKSKGTKPELAVRQLISRCRVRYQLHRSDLPGTPDLTIVNRRKVVFVNGCFWHGHTCVRGSRVPVQNREYWVEKILRNKKRDRETARQLKRLTWQHLIIWECELRNMPRLRAKILRFLNQIAPH